MVKRKNQQQADWQKRFKKLVTKHYTDNIKARRLINQLHQLIVRHTKLKFNVTRDRENFSKKIELMDFMRNELNRLLKDPKFPMTAERREKLREYRMRLPADSLLDSIRLMELSEYLPDFSTSSKVNSLQHWHAKHMKRLIRHINKQERVLDRIDDKMMATISDIHDLKCTIEYVQNSRGSRIKIRPFLERMNWLDTHRSKPEVKATIAIESRKHRTRQVMDVRPSYILKNIPKLMPDTFHYLNA